MASWTKGNIRNPWSIHFVKAYSSNVNIERKNSDERFKAIPIVPIIGATNLLFRG
jgi:hypothetical protein